MRFIRKLLTDLCLECTRFPLSFSKWLMHSMIYLFLSIILSHSDPEDEIRFPPEIFDANED